MSTYTHTAIRCFRENAQFIDPKKQPIEWNLANGLMQLAQAVEGIEREIEDVKRRVQQIEYDVRH